MTKEKLTAIISRLEDMEKKINDNHAFLQKVEFYSKKIILVLVIVLLSFKFDMSTIKEILQLIK